jgi:hypothetical protein
VATYGSFRRFTVQTDSVIQDQRQPR